MTREQVRADWNRTVDDWMRSGVGYRYQGDDPRTGLDCWRGVVRLLYRRAGIELPDYVKEEQDRQGRRHIGDGILERYRALFRPVGWNEARLGDVLTLVFPRDTHAGVLLDDGWVAHATEGAGVCRSRLAALVRRASAYAILRYHGPGAEIFAQ
jgi:cell wall-associated NlpC family hydrolase